MTTTMWIWTAVGVHYIFTALAIYLEKHGEVERQKTEKCDEVQPGDIAEPIAMAILWPLILVVNPFWVVSAHVMDYITFDKANREITERNKKRYRNSRLGWPFFP